MVKSAPHKTLSVMVLVKYYINCNDWKRIIIKIKFACKSRISENIIATSDFEQVKIRVVQSRGRSRFPDNPSMHLMPARTMTAKANNSVLTGSKSSTVFDQRVQVLGYFRL